MLAAAALVAGTSLVAKGLGGPWAGPLHPLQVTAGRFLFALAALLALVAALPARRPSLAGTPWGLHARRVACGAGGVTLLFAAAARMPLAEATALSFLSPLVTMALAVPLLGDRIGARQALAAGLSVAGAAILLRPGAEAVRPAALLALGSAALLGLEAVFIKRLADREPPVRMLLVSNAMGCALILPAAALVWTPPGPAGWSLLAAVGILMVLGQACFIQAMRRARASSVVPAFYASLVFAAAYDAAAFGTVPSAAALIGAGLILAGALVLATAGTPLRAPDEDAARRDRPGRS